MQEMGFNALRLGTMWAGAEPERGVWNSSYLETIGSIVDNLAAHNIYSILDCHQDVFNRHLCVEGFPDWAVNSNGGTALPFALPVGEIMTFDNVTGLPEQCGLYAWTLYYLTDLAGKSFQGLYDNYNGLQDEFINFWTRVATMALSRTSVLGYEFINEPWSGDIYSNPDLLLPEVADLTNLQPMYDNIANAIRKIDTNHLMFYEPITYVITPTGFTHVPGGSMYQNMSVLSWHYYCWIFNPDNMTEPEWIFCDDMEGPDFFYQRTIDINKLGGASFLTEWGAFCNGVTPDGHRECDWVMSEADNYLVSWTYWAIEEIFDGDNPIPQAVNILSRTYPQAIAGVPTQMSFDPDSFIFNMKYIADTTIELPTEIYLNELLHYPNGFTVTITPTGVLSVEASHNQISLVKTDLLENQMNIMVQIVPK